MKATASKSHHHSLKTVQILTNTAARYLVTSTYKLRQKVGNNGNNGNNGDNGDNDYNYLTITITKVIRPNRRIEFKFKIMNG